MRRCSSPGAAPDRDERKHSIDSESEKKYTLGFVLCFL